MPRKNNKAQEALTDSREGVMSQQLVPKKKKDEPEVVTRPTALDFKKTEKLKELILQDVKRGRTQTAMQYTKSLVSTYLQNPYNFRTQIVSVSRFLYRVSAIYRKIILYYATMPKYNYCIVEAPSFTKEINVNKMMNDYEKVLLAAHRTNFKEEFATAIALAIRDGIFCGYAYSSDEGTFFHMLPVEYYRIEGKNEAGMWTVAFDATYFAVGQNRIFVEGIDGDTTGCWADEFVEGWKAYQANRDARWFILDPSKTLVLLGGLQDEFDNPLPFFTGLFPSILNMLSAEELVADRTELDNFYLLLLGIDTFNDGNSIVDDFEVSLELANAYKDALVDIMPRLSAVGLVPGLKPQLISFSKANSTNDESIVQENINNIFAQSGASQTIVSSGDGQSALSIKYSLLNDFSYVALLLSRLEKNYQYYIDKNIAEGTIFTIHHQTHYNEDEYIERLKTMATLGGSAMKLLTSMNMSPYEAYCTMRFESAIGLKDMMEPLESSYQKSTNDNDSGRPRASDDEISPSAERTKNIVDDNV